MKKTTILVILILYSVSLYGQTEGEKKHTPFSLTIGAGVGGAFQDRALFVFAIDASLCGFHMDVGGHARSHGQDVKVGEWKDKEAFFIHAGYKIPIAKHLELTPLVGYYECSKGVTDGWDWTVDSGGIHNKYHKEEDLKEFDFGGQITYCKDFWTIKATCTKNVMTVGLGFTVDL